MVMPRSNGAPVEVLGVERRRRWSREAKAAMVAETYEPGVSVSLVARRHGVAPSQLFGWRRLAEGGALAAIGGGEPVVPDREAQALRQRIRDLERLLGRKTMKRDPQDAVIQTAISGHIGNDYAARWPRVRGKVSGR